MSKRGDKAFHRSTTGWRGRDVCGWAASPDPPTHVPPRSQIRLDVLSHRFARLQPGTASLGSNLAPLRPAPTRHGVPASAWGLGRRWRRSDCVETRGATRRAFTRRVGFTAFTRRVGLTAVGGSRTDSDCVETRGAVTRRVGFTPSYSVASSLCEGRQRNRRAPPSRASESRLRVAPPSRRAWRHVGPPRRPPRQF